MVGEDTTVTTQVATAVKDMTVTVPTTITLQGAQGLPSTVTVTDMVQEVKTVASTTTVRILGVGNVVLSTITVAKEGIKTVVYESIRTVPATLTIQVPNMIMVITPQMVLVTVYSENL